MSNKENKKKDPKRKPKYGMLSCVGYIYKLLWNHERGLVFVGLFTIPISLCLSALSLYTPSLILSALETSDRFSYIALVIFGLLLAKLIFDSFNNVINTKIGNSEHYVLTRMQYMFQSELRDRDWYIDFDPEIEKLNARADNAIQNNHTAGVHFPMDFANMISQILKFLLFGSVISLLNPVIILLLALGTVLNSLMSKWQRNKDRDDRDIRNALDKKINYCTFGMSQDFKYAKDVRLYSMANSIKERLNSIFQLRENEQRKIEKRAIFVSVISFLIVLLRDGAAYILLISKAINGEVDASSFVLYFSAITAMSTWLFTACGRHLPA